MHAVPDGLKFCQYDDSRFPFLTTVDLGSEGLRSDTKLSRKRTLPPPHKGYPSARKV
jgi:hypothetical protein